jgi:hypothetical protein
MTSAVLIIPTALRGAANAVGAAMGWGPENYTLALSNDGATVTHYACRTDVEPTFLGTMIAAGYDMARAGLTPDQIAAIPPMIEGTVIPAGVAIVLAALDIDLSETLWGADHMADALAWRGLSHA